MMTYLIGLRIQEKKGYLFVSTKNTCLSVTSNNLEINISGAKIANSLEKKLSSVITDDQFIFKNSLDEMMKNAVKNLMDLQKSHLCRKQENNLESLL